MHSLGRRCEAMLTALAICGALLTGFAFVGFAGDVEMIWASIITLGCWGPITGFSVYGVTLANKLRNGDHDRLLPTLKWTRGLLLTAGIVAWSTAWVCGFLAFATCGVTFLAPLYHWGGLVLGSLAFLGYFLLPGWVQDKVGAHPPYSDAPERWRWITTLSVLGFFVVVWLAAIIVMANYEDKDDYRARAVSGFSLPYPAGTTAWLIQGASSLANHSDNLAYDFRLACGTDILASAPGVVRGGSTDANTGHTGDAKDNWISVNLDGGGYVQYGHIKQGSMTVRVGDRVERGQKIAEVGNVGNSLTGHIHWEVYDANGKTQASTFVDEDVEYHDGIPRSFWYYTSSNARVR